MAEERPGGCAVCGKAWRRRHGYGRCCSQPCSNLLSAAKRLKRLSGPWEPSDRDRWARWGLRAFRNAWKAPKA